MYIKIVFDERQTSCASVIVDIKYNVSLSLMNVNHYVQTLQVA